MLCYYCTIQFFCRLFSNTTAEYICFATSLCRRRRCSWCKMVNSGGGPDNNNMAPPLSYNEERNILICGPKNSGKSSLAFTLCRGIYPQAAGLLPAGCPGRFEGWSIGACATPISALTVTQSASLHHNSVRSRGKGAGGANSSSSKDPSLRPYFVNFTLWEDRPRIGLDQQGSSKKNSTASNVSSSNDSAEPKGKMQTLFWTVFERWELLPELD